MLPAPAPVIDRGRVRQPTSGRLASWARSAMRRGLGFVPCLIALAFGFSACRPADPAADLVILNGPEPESLDPAIFTGQADGRIGLALFEGLTRFHPETADPEPGLAERWEISDDGRRYLFHLRPAARWSTGEPITAADVEYSWRRVLDPATGSEYAALLFYIKNAEAAHRGQLARAADLGVRALSQQQLEVELENPTPFFLDLCAAPTLSVVPRQAIERGGDRWLLQRPLPTSGAYTLAAWRLNDRVRLHANPFYWDAANTASTRVDVLSCALASTAVSLYETGAADIIWDKDLVPSELLDALRARSDFHSFHYLATYFLRFNTTRPPFDDPRVRRALAMSIDKRRIVEKITRGGERPALHYTPPGLRDYEPPAGVAYDPETARRLLAEAGFPEGRGFRPFQYLYNSNGRVHEQIAIELQAMWQRELNLRVDLRKLEWKVFLNTQGRLEYDLCRSSWIGDYNDATTFLDMFTSDNGNNRTGWRSAPYDGLLRSAAGQSDPRTRARLLQDAERLLVEAQAPIAPLYFYVGFNRFDPQLIRGVYQNLRDEHPLRAIRKVPRPVGPPRAATASSSPVAQLPSGD